MQHQVNVFEWYAGHVRPGMSVLDWGCNHGPDACLLRQRFGAIDLHACDFNAEDTFRTFRDNARGTPITDPLSLPYPAESFDVVIGSGVLEHTAMDGEALKELYRVVRPHGLLVISYLAYAYSWDEWRPSATSGSVTSTAGCTRGRRLAEPSSPGMGFRSARNQLPNPRSQCRRG